MYFNCGRSYLVILHFVLFFGSLHFLLFHPILHVAPASSRCLHTIIAVRDAGVVCLVEVGSHVFIYLLMDLIITSWWDVRKKHVWGGSFVFEIVAEGWALISGGMELVILACGSN